ncbi:MAG: GHKL domain-containing protein [Myxococcales bacterium]|nr:GHKL domain-containing protein [Myxococcales bacterium]
MLSATLVALSSGALIYTNFRRHLFEQLDAELGQQADDMTHLILFGARGLEFEWEEWSGHGAASFQIRGATGIEKRTGALAAADLRWPEQAPAPWFATQGVEGAPLRIVFRDFRPNLEPPLPAGQDVPDLQLAVASPLQPANDALARMRRWIALATLASLAVGALLIWVFVTRALRPLATLAGRLGDRAPDALSPIVLDPGAPNELLPVIGALNGLLARLQRFVQREQALTNAAAHELRTPLAGLRAKLELALSRPRAPEAHRALADEALAICLEMQATVQTLLDLARLGDAADVVLEAVVLGELIDAAWAPLAEAATRRGLTLQRSEGSQTIRVDRVTLRLVIGNLLANAVSHSDEGSAIRLDAAVAAHRLRVVVANAASGVGPDEAAHALEPFWRRDAARTADEGHVGLGLTLCQRALQRAGGAIEVMAEAGVFEVRVDLPVGD